MCEAKMDVRSTNGCVKYKLMCEVHMDMRYKLMCEVQMDMSNTN
jgi:hypothetical protein